MKRAASGRASVAAILVPVVVASIVGGIVSCGRADDFARFAEARDETASLTIYYGLSLYPDETDTSHFDRFVEAVGFSIDSVQLSSWYVPVEYSPPIDILDNLDLLINDDRKLYDANPIRKREMPDLVVSYAGDQYIRAKAASGYFDPIDDVLRLSPELVKAHDPIYWEVNDEALDGYGFPLYSFQYDDAPAYWLIDARARRELMNAPISGFSGILEFAELADRVATSGPVISTSTIPLGALALAAAGYFGVDFYRRDETTGEPAGSLLATSSGGTAQGYSSRSRWSPPTRSYELLARTATSPFLYAAETGAVLDVVTDPPQWFLETMERVTALVAGGNVDQERNVSRGIQSLLLGTCRAVLIPADSGLTWIYTLMERFPDDFAARFEIVPFHEHPIASLEASFAAWVPRTSEKRTEIAKLFTSASDAERRQAARYGDPPGHYRLDEPNGIGTGESGVKLPCLPERHAVDILTRTGLPELVPAVIPAGFRGAFRVDDLAVDTYLASSRVLRRYDATRIEAAIGRWNELAGSYLAALRGKERFPETVAFIRDRAAAALEAISNEIARQDR